MNDHDPWQGPLPTLTGFGLVVAPLLVEHAAELLPFSPPETFRYFNARPADASLRAFRDFLDAGLADASRWAFIVRDAATGAALGSSSFLDLRPAHRGLEIGCTWYAPAVRGTRVNPVCKFLLLEHAFGAMDAARVQLKCDDRNEHSKRAIARTGARFEGVLRKHMILPDGFVRDTAMFSIIREEWPTVREGLVARAGGSSPQRPYHPGTHGDQCQSSRG